MASSYWKRAQQKRSYQSFSAAVAKSGGAGNEDFVAPALERGSHQGDSQAPHIGAHVIALSGRTGVYPLRLKHTRVFTQVSRSPVVEWPGTSSASIDLPCESHLWLCLRIQDILGYLLVYC